MPPPDVVFVASHDLRVVTLSVAISILAAYAARALSERLAAARGRAWLAWLVGGATADGLGTWSMHYTGMLGLELPVPVLYHWPTVVLSLLVGVAGSGAALVVASGGARGTLRALAASAFMGGVGISGLHYTAMGAMRMPAGQHHALGLLPIPIVLAIAISSMALSLIFRDDGPARRLRRHASAVLRGLANPVMHYTAMAAMTFTYARELPDLSRAVSIESLGLAGVSIVPVMVLVVALLTSVVDRLRRQRVLLDELFEQAPQAIALTAGDGRVVRVNREFMRLFGYTPSEVLGRRLIELIGGDGGEAARRAPPGTAGERMEAEAVRRHKDGRRLDVFMVRVPVSLPDEEILTYEIFLDVAARRRAEEELRRSRDQLRALAGRLQTVGEEERTRLAREIHDVMGQALTAIKTELTLLFRELAPAVGTESPRPRSIMRLLDHTFDAARRIATELRPSILDDLGLVAAVLWATQEFETRTGIRCEVSISGMDVPVDRERATAMFRILLEALTNVERHANAAVVNVIVAREDGDVVLVVHDNGRGIPEGLVAAGLGITGMRERAALLGGSVTIRSAPGESTTVTVRIPEDADSRLER